MKVILHINDATELTNAQACLKWALSEPELTFGAATHYDGRGSYFERLKSGTIVIRVQAKQEAK